MRHLNHLNAFRAAALERMTFGCPGDNYRGVFILPVPTGRCLIVTVNAGAVAMTGFAGDEATEIEVQHVQRILDLMETGGAGG